LLKGQLSCIQRSCVQDGESHAHRNANPQKTVDRAIRPCHARSSGAKNNENRDFLDTSGVMAAALGPSVTRCDAS